MSKSNYRNLEVWQTARFLARDIYRATRIFPRDERFGIVPQMRRAAVSILCNIAEGAGRWSASDQKNFYVIARGSALELESQLVIAEDVEYMSPEAAAELTNRTCEVARMLNGLIRYLNSGRK